MRKQWKQLIAVLCTAIMLETMPCASVLADEPQEEENNVLDSIDPALEAESSNAVISTDEVLTGSEALTVGDDVMATFDAETGAVEFFSNNGTLWKNWMDRAGLLSTSITSIRVASGTVYLPADSSYIFANIHDLGNNQKYESNLTKIDLSGFNTSNVTNMSSMFRGCYWIKELDLSEFDTSNVKDMGDMFYECYEIESLNLTSFNTSKVTNMSGLFFLCVSLKFVDLSSFNTTNVTNMSYLFSNCQSLTSIDSSFLDTSHATDMSGMFYQCESIKSLDLTTFDTSSVTTMSQMFSQCYNLVTLNLSSFDASKVINVNSMFECNNKLSSLKTPCKSKCKISLPTAMYDNLGREYIELPVLTASLTLTNKKPATIRFSDVQNSSHAYYKAIYWAADTGITKGYPDGTFGINRSCTRGEMIMFLWRFAGKPLPKAVWTSPFKDAPMSHTFFKAILWAYQKGITKGYSDGTFGVNRNVSRGEAMMFLWRLKGKPAPKTAAVSPFRDVLKTHVFYKAILWGYQKKVTTGYTSGKKKGKFGINENCTRGQIVTFLYRAK